MPRLERDEGVNLSQAHGVQSLASLARESRLARAMLDARRPPLARARLRDVVLGGSARRRLTFAQVFCRHASSESAAVRGYNS